MQSITEDVTDLVLEHHGSFSGEPVAVLAGTVYKPKIYGEDLWEAFQEVKSVFDPGLRMNPGKVVYSDENPTDMRENLRYGAEYNSVEPQTKLDFTDEGGFSHLVELCNGCRTCRKTDSVMGNLDSGEDTPVAPGPSCQSQIGDRETTTERPPHPIEKVNELLPT